MFVFTADSLDQAAQGSSQPYARRDSRGISGQMSTVEIDIGECSVAGQRAQGARGGRGAQRGAVAQKRQVYENDRQHKASAGF